MMRILATRTLAHLRGHRKYAGQIKCSDIFGKSLDISTYQHNLQNRPGSDCNDAILGATFPLCLLGYRQIHNSKGYIHQTRTMSSKTSASPGEGSSSQIIDRVYKPFLIFFRAIVITAEITMLSMWQLVEKDVKKRAEKLRRSLIRLGPFYIKLGQALSTRPDILPQDYCQELAKLQDQIPPFSSSKAFKYLESELGSPAWKLFSEITEEPVAAASLGQVYKARLHSGELVAVKVQRPGIPSWLELDAQLLHLVGGQLERFAGAHGDLLAVVDQMVVHMYEEIDYLLEGKNAELFYNLYGLSDEELSEHNLALKEDKKDGKSSFSKHDWHKFTRKQQGKREGLVKVPKVYWEFTTKGVLTMEWIEGIKLTDKKALAEANLDIQELVDQGVFCSLRQLLEDGFFHADPHPGNFVVSKEGVLAYFDFGMMGNLPRADRVGLIRTLVHFVNRDSDGLARDFLSLGFISQGINLEPIAEDLRKSFGEETSKSQLDFQGIMNQLYAVMYKFNFRLPPEYGMVIRALGSLEGTATTLDPEFRVVASAYPFVVGRLLSDPDPEMRQILRELLIRNDQSIRWHRLERLVVAIAEQSAPLDNNNEYKMRLNSAQQISQKKSQSGMRRKSFDTRAVASATADLLNFVFSDKGIGVRLMLAKDLSRALDMIIYRYVYTLVDSEPHTRTNSGNMYQTPRDGTSHEVYFSDGSTRKPYDDHTYVTQSGNTHSPGKVLNFNVTSANSYHISNLLSWTFHKLLGETHKNNGSTYEGFVNNHRDATRTDRNNYMRSRTMNDQGSQEEEKGTVRDDSQDVDFGSRLLEALYAFVKAIEAAPEVWIPLLASYVVNHETMRLFQQVACTGGHSFCHHISEATILSISKSLHDARI